MSLTVKNMINLIIMRHAEAEALCSSDSARRLTPHGRQQAQQMASWFAQQGLSLDYVFCSPYCRTAQTADEFLTQLGVHVPLASWQELTPDQQPYDVRLLLEATLSQLLQMTASSSEQPTVQTKLQTTVQTSATVLLVSHMPLVSFLVGEFAQPHETPLFEPAAMALVQFQMGQRGQLCWQYGPSQWQACGGQE